MMRTKKPLNYLKLIFNYILFIATFAIFSCNQSGKIEIEYTHLDIEKALALDHSNWDSLELFMPQLGCESCIDKLVKQYKSHTLGTRLTIVGVQKERDLRLTYGDEFLDGENVDFSLNLTHKDIAEECFELPSLLFYISPNKIYYFCFKTDEVDSVIEYLLIYEKRKYEL